MQFARVSGLVAPMANDNIGSVAVFGATGTIGDGLLKAAINDRVVETVYAVSRRPSPRAQAVPASERVKTVSHEDYRDYSAIRDVLADVNAVFWAIGRSAVGMEEEAYKEIHATFPLTFISEWMSTSDKTDISFHYVSGSGVNARSRMMWAREKAHAEAALKESAQGSNLRVISYRPSFILPTESEAHIGHRILYAVFAPIKAAVAAESIGNAMLEVCAHRSELVNGSVLENAGILSYAKAYEDRQRR